MSTLVLGDIQTVSYRQVMRIHYFRMLYVALLIAVLASPRVLAAHEVAQTSAMVSVRSGGHITLQLQISWANILHAAWAPTRPLSAFLGQTSNDPADLFARRYAQFVKHVAPNVRLVTPEGSVIEFQNWRWPPSTQVQSALREELMELMVSGNVRAHKSRLATTAEAIVPLRVANVRLSVADQLGATLVTVAHPEEQWIRGGGMTSSIRIHRMSAR